MKWSRRVISIVALCHGAKLCAHAARDFRSQQRHATDTIIQLYRIAGLGIRLYVNVHEILKVNISPFASKAGMESLFIISDRMNCAFAGRS